MCEILEANHRKMLKWLNKRARQRVLIVYLTKRKLLIVSKRFYLCSKIYSWERELGMLEQQRTKKKVGNFSSFVDIKASQASPAIWKFFLWFRESLLGKTFRRSSRCFCSSVWVCWRGNAKLNLDKLTILLGDFTRRLVNTRKLHEEKTLSVRQWWKN